MMPYQIYQVWQVERIKTTTQHYAADGQRGMLAAAASGSVQRAGSIAVSAAAAGRRRLARAVRLGRAHPTARVTG